MPKSKHPSQSRAPVVDATSSSPGHHPWPSPPCAFQKGVSAQKTPEQRPAQAESSVTTALSCSRAHSRAANPLQFLFLLLQRQQRARRSAKLVPSSILLGWSFFLLSFLYHFPSSLA